MAGISKDDVFAAAQQIWNDEAKKPTQEAVRAVLGRGSFATINKYLKEWREEYREDLAAPEVEEAPPEEFAPLWQRFYNSLKANLEEKIVSDQVRLLEADNERLQAELEDYRITKIKFSESSSMWEKLIADRDRAIIENARLQQYAELADRTEELAQERDAAVQAIESLVSEKDALASQNAELTRTLAKHAKQVSDLENRIKELELEVTESKKNSEELANLKMQLGQLQEQLKTAQADKKGFEQSLSERGLMLTTVGSEVIYLPKAVASLVVAIEDENKDLKAQLAALTVNLPQQEGTVEGKDFAAKTDDFLAEVAP